MYILNRLWWLLFFFSFFRISYSSFWNWLGPSSSYDNTGTEIQAIIASAEVKTKEDKFFEDAKQLLVMSPLDICQHKIILKLKSSCSVLSEEALSKISVNLLNCHAEAEGRKKVPCTEEMTLKECTQEMDPSTWNLYHMMNVRARSVCYLTRQQQFNAYSDMMLDRLTRAAHDQIAVLSSLEEGQDRIQCMARETLISLSETQKQLKIGEAEIAAQRKKLEAALSANAEAINAQGVLLAEAQEELSQFMNDIKNAFDSSGPANINSTQIEQVLFDILSMLSMFRNKSEDSWKEIEINFSTSDVLLQKIRLQREELVYKATAIRNIVTSAIAYVEDVHSNIILFLSWLFCFACNAGDHEAEVSCYVQHALLTAENLLLWLLVRIELRTLVLIMYCNFMIYYWRVNYALKHSNLTMELFLLIIGQWLFLKLCKHLIARKTFFITVVRKIVRWWYRVKIFIKNFRGADLNWKTSHLIQQDRHQHTHGHSQRVLRGLRSPSEEMASRELQSSCSPTPLHWEPPSTSGSLIHLRSATPLPANVELSPSHIPTTSHLPTSSTSHSPNIFHTSTPWTALAEAPKSYRHTPSSYTPNRSTEVLSPKPLCGTVCKTGKLCRNPVAIGEELCYRHLGML